jgi:hypothetical protein
MYLLLRCLAATLVSVLFVSGCTAPEPFRAADALRRNGSTVSIVLLRPDVMFCPPGISCPRVEVRPDTAEEIQSGVISAVRSEMADRNITLTVVDPRQFAEADRREFVEVQRLPDGIESARRMPFAPPTSRGRLPWSIGSDAAAELRRHGGADYALLLTVLVQNRGGLLIDFALGGDLGGGSSMAWATLVDLRTGAVAWADHRSALGGVLTGRGSQTAWNANVRWLLEGFPR